MFLNIALSEGHNLIMLFDTDPDTAPPNNIVLMKIDIPPDNVKELVDRYISSGYNVIVTPIVVKKCGLKQKDFDHITRDGKTATKMGSIEDITATLMELERRRMENEQ
jgi:hypothetical protein